MNKNWENGNKKLFSLRQKLKTDVEGRKGWKTLELFHESNQLKAESASECEK